MGEKIGEGSPKKRNGSFRSIFMHADHADVLLMILGFLGALGDGLSMPLVILVTSKLMNNIGGASNSVADAFTQNINKVSHFLSLYIHVLILAYNVNEI